MSKQTLVRVNKIESYRDLNGSLGKKIEIVEEPENIPGGVIKLPEELTMVMEMMTQIQKQVPGLMQMQKPVSPKMILFLTEDEYEDLGVTLDVNQTYNVTFEGAAIKFNKEIEQYIGTPLTPPPEKKEEP
jgi:stage III sporulation protein SpoIIIAA